MNTHNNGSTGKSVLQRTGKKLFTYLLAFSLLLFIQMPAQAADDAAGFSHFSTGFPLTGKHEFIDCSSCHLSGQFKGTPLECGLCHNESRAPGKHAQHFPSNNICDDCHTDISWKGARFDHGDIQGPCQNCHNNSVVVGKSPAHILSTPLCDDCHNTITFNRVGKVDHASVIGTCNACHNGFTALGKPPTHVTTNDQCDACHSTISWSNARFDHSNVAGQCSSCHNGVTAPGKHPAHLQTTAECDNCHSTTTWLGATFDHAQVTGLCASCHNGGIATGKTTTHFVTTTDCENCHTTTSWLQLVLFRHNSPDYPGDHRTATLCIDCHTTNNQVIAWPYPTYKPNCAGCHTDDYKSDSHKGVGDVPIPIVDVADCNGSCHLKESIRSNEHRAGDAEW